MSLTCYAIHSRLQDPELRVDVWAEMPLGPSGWSDLEESKAPHMPHDPAPSGLDLFHRLLLLDHSLADHLNEDVSLMFSIKGEAAMGLGCLKIFLEVLRF